MLNNVYENDLGYMVGTFYSNVFECDIDVWYKKHISREYVEKNIQYLNDLDNDFLLSICAALKRYYEDYKRSLPDLCEDIPYDILHDFEKEPRSILKYVNIGVYKFDEFRIDEEAIPVINLRGSCEWSGDEGITIAAKNNQLLYVGPWKNFNVWDSRWNTMFNYATPIEK